MIKLSKRLKSIYDLIPIDTDVVDIGCDHGLLDIYLVSTRNIKVTASDISINALEGAIKNATKYNVKDKINFVVSNGLDKINLNNEIIVMSGMGTYTMLEILKSSKIKNNLILLQTNNNIDYLRREMVKKGYYIKDEKAVFDKKWYNIILFEKGKCSYDEIDYIIGPFNKNNKEYVSYYLNKYSKYKSYDNEIEIVKKYLG